ncbi:MAG: class I SAM-dependent methyltransferase, partial [Tannerellaceae bacterium]
MSEIINAEQSFNENILISFFKNIERQGPGSDDETRKALQFIVPLNSNSTILDIGCGTGQQTMVLANATTAKIIATD